MGRFMSVKEWRKYRDQAGILLHLISLVPKDRREKAWRIYHEWRDWKITFSEAKKKLKELAK